MDDVRGLFLGMPHGTTPAVVTTNKNIIMRHSKERGWARQLFRIINPLQ